MFGELEVTTVLNLSRSATMQTDRPHPATERHYSYRPTNSQDPIGKPLKAAEATEATWVSPWRAS